MFYEQKEYDIRLEWGAQGVKALGPSSDAVIIVDVLSFTTCVDIALSRGTTIFPCAWRGERAEAFAREHDAILASKRSNLPGEFSLAPSSLIQIPGGLRLVLPSPNGSTLSLAAAEYCVVMAGCVRNGTAVAHYAQSHYQKISIIPCGERWKDQSLRPSLEDLIGAGAIISSLTGSKSPEAVHAETVFKSYANLADPIAACSSGVELIEKGFPEDVSLASQHNVSACVPLFANGRYTDIS